MTHNKVHNKMRSFRVSVTGVRHEAIDFVTRICSHSLITVVL